MDVPGIKIVRFALAGLLILTGCDKANLDPVTQLKVRLTDAPLSAQEVNIQVKEVRIKFANDTAETKLNTKEGIYNLLDYRDGKDTLIAQAIVPATSTVQEVSIILGDNNTLKINNEIHQLNIPGNSRSAIKITVEKKLNRNIETLTLDFDAALSVIELGKGNYQLNPVIRLK